MDYQEIIDANGKKYLEVNLSDYGLVFNSILNKGMAFTERERDEFNLFGILPPHQATIDQQHARSIENFYSKKTDLEKYLYLRDLQDSNETLFYHLVCNHLPEMMPIIYTPTVGLGCQKYSHIYRRPRGVFISYPYRHRIDQILANPRFDNVQVIVVSDGERILGLGDQGIGGMGIPVGKLSLYTACAGIRPDATLPILLDTGTDNTELVSDPLYMGWRHSRIRGQEYQDFLEIFVQAIKKRFPHVLLQWEDFAQQNANPILQRYRHQLCTFNDDIQGTAAVATGALLAAVQKNQSKLRDQQIVITGAGSAGCGISDLIVKAMIAEGLSEADARSRFYLIDRNGLLIEGMPGLYNFQKPYLQPTAKIANWQCSNRNHITLHEVVNNLHPTILIGVSGQTHLFTETIVREMASHTERPIIFPLSNPTSCCEANPNDLMEWTNGRAIVSTGSPFANFDQTNNCYVFPGLGLGLIAVKARLVTDQMFMAAALTLAEHSPAKHDPEARLLPALSDIRQISLHVALAVAKEAIKSGLSDYQFESNAELEKYLASTVWEPDYLPYRRKPGS